MNKNNNYKAKTTLNLVGIKLLKVKNGNTRTRCEYVQSNNKESRTTPWHRPTVFIVNFEHVIAGWEG